MNYKRLRDDTLKIIYREIYYRDYVGIEFDATDEDIKNYIDRQIVITILDDDRNKMNSEIFSTDIEQLIHPALALNDYAKLYNTYRFIAKRYDNNFAKDMRSMLAVIITDRLLRDNMLGQVKYNDYDGEEINKGTSYVLTRNEIH
jgi:hypothetical protein